MSGPIGSNGPSGPEYSPYQRAAAPWTAADALYDTGPIPRQSAASRPAAAGVPGRQTVGVAKLLGLTIAALGALNFLWGFLPELTAARSQESLSVFAVGPAYVPVLLLIGGLLALAALLPGGEVSRLAVAAISVGGAAGAIVALGSQGPVQLVSTTQVSKGMGAILLVIFGIIQAVVAVGAYVVGTDALPWGRGNTRRAEPAAGAAGPAVAAAGTAAAGTAPAGTAPAGSAPAGSVAPAAPNAPNAGRPAGSGGGYGGGYGPNTADGTGSGYSAGAVQPGWFAPAQAWPSHDPRNTPADDRPTGPQQVVRGTESHPERPPVTHSEVSGSAGPAGQPDLDTPVAAESAAISPAPEEGSRDRSGS